MDTHKFYNMYICFWQGVPMWFLLFELLVHQHQRVSVKDSNPPKSACPRKLQGCGTGQQYMSRLKVHGVTVSQMWPLRSGPLEH